MHCLEGARRYDESWSLSTADALASKSECADDMRSKPMMHASATATNDGIANAVNNGNKPKLLSWII